MRLLEDPLLSSSLVARFETQNIILICTLCNRHSTDDRSVQHLTTNYCRSGKTQFMCAHSCIVCWCCYCFKKRAFLVFHNIFIFTFTIHTNNIHILQRGVLFIEVSLYINSVRSFNLCSDSSGRRLVECYLCGLFS